MKVKILFLALIALLCAVQVNAGEVIQADCDSIVSFSPDGTFLGKRVFLYGGDILIGIEYYGSSYENGEKPFNKDVYEYTDGHLSAIYYYYRDRDTGDDTWHPNSKETYEYAGGNVSARFYYAWEATGNDWSARTKTEYYYDAQGRLSSDVFTQFWNNNRQSKNEYQYDAAGRLVFTCQYSWDNATNGLEVIPSYKTEKQYDAQGNEIKEISHRLMTSGQYGISSEFVYQNNSQGKKISADYYQSEEVYSLDGQYSTVYYGVLSTETFEYDALGRETRNYYSYTYKYELGNGVTLSSRTLSSSTCYYYRSKTGINRPEVDKEGERISVSPSAETLLLSGLQGNETLSVYSLSGSQLLRSKATGETKTLSIAHLPAGMYLLSIQSNRGVSTHKFIKK